MLPEERMILLSFDVEEFDTPLEYNYPIPLEEQFAVADEGLYAVQSILQSQQIPSTLFTTANYAEHNPDLIRELSRDNEIASHSFYHSRFQTPDLLSSRITLEKIIGRPVLGIRMPRMKMISSSDITQAGYKYDSSLHPTWLPGRYNNLRQPKTPFYDGLLLRIPASVTPSLRLPLFWLSFKNMPYQFYLGLIRKTLRKFGFVTLYFHPWEFTDLRKYNLPTYVRKIEGDKLLERLTRLITDLGPHGEFQTMKSFYSAFIAEKKI